MEKYPTSSEISSSICSISDEGALNISKAPVLAMPCSSDAQLNEESQIDVTVGDEVISRTLSEDYLLDIEYVSLCPTLEPESILVGKNEWVHVKKKSVICVSGRDPLHPADKPRRRGRPTCEESTHQCNFCGRNYLSLSALTTHIQGHNKKKPFTCVYCDKTFASRSEHKIHIRTHTGERPFQCSVCDKRFSCQTSHSAHMFTHKGEKCFTCDICNKSFFFKSQRDVHIKIHTRKKSFECFICDKVFDSSRSRYNHQFIHKESQTAQRTTEPEASVSLSNKAGCDSSVSHLVAIKEEEFEQSVDEDVQENVEKRRKRHSESDSKDLCVKPCARKVFTANTVHNIHKCITCNKHFSSVFRLRRHVKTHQFVCAFCDKSFSKVEDRNRHGKTHFDDEPIKCDLCDVKCLTPNTLKRHMRVHTEGKPNTCDLCNKVFTEHRSLILHLQLHTGERAFKCEICNKSFTRKFHLDRHLRSHTRRKTYRCTVCGEVFNSARSCHDHRCIGLDVKRETEIVREDSVLACDGNLGNTDPPQEGIAMLSNEISRRSRSDHDQTETDDNVNVWINDGVDEGQNENVDADISDVFGSLGDNVDGIVETDVTVKVEDNVNSAEHIVFIESFDSQIGAEIEDIVEEDLLENVSDEVGKEDVIPSQQFLEEHSYVRKRPCFLPDLFLSSQLSPVSGGSQSEASAEKIPSRTVFGFQFPEEEEWWPDGVEKPSNCGIWFGSERPSSNPESKPKRRRRSRAASEDQLFCCDYCQKDFSQISELRLHIFAHLSEVVPGRNSYARVTAEAGKTALNACGNPRSRAVPYQLFRCDYCQEDFSQKSELRLHIFAHLSEVVPGRNSYARVTAEAGKTALSAGSNRRRRVVPYKLFRCDYCQEDFSQISELRLHIFAHLSEEEVLRISYVCVTTEAGKIAYECSICRKQILLLHNMKQHFEAHKREKYCLCEYCGKIFSAKCNLFIHSRIHTGVRPFKCDICDKGFRRSHHLAVHARTHTREKLKCIP